MSLVIVSTAAAVTLASVTTFGILHDHHEVAFLVFEVGVELAGRTFDQPLDVRFGIVEIQRHQGHDALSAGCRKFSVELLILDCLPVLIHHEHADRDQRGRAEHRECHRDDLEDEPPPATAWRGLLLFLADGVGKLGGDGLVIGRCIHRDFGGSASAIQPPLWTWLRIPALRGAAGSPGPSRAPQRRPPPPRPPRPPPLRPATAHRRSRAVRRRRRFLDRIRVGHRRTASE